MQRLREMLVHTPEKGQQFVHSTTSAPPITPATTMDTNTPCLPYGNPLHSTDQPNKSAGFDIKASNLHVDFCWCCWFFAFVRWKIGCKLSVSSVFLCRIQQHYAQGFFISSIQLKQWTTAKNNRIKQIQRGYKMRALNGKRTGARIFLNTLYSYYCINATIEIEQILLYK